jgi:hypothetical protein
MDDEAEHALVVKALEEGLGNCVEWEENSAILVLEDKELQGITPAFIRRQVIDFVRTNGGAVVVQRAEMREAWREKYRFYYMIILPQMGFTNGLFVELRLSDDDPDFPVVTLVHAHPQTRS